MLPDDNVPQRSFSGVVRRLDLLMVLEYKQVLNLYRSSRHALAIALSAQPRPSCQSQFHHALQDAGLFVEALLGDVAVLNTVKIVKQPVRVIQQTLTD